MNAKCVNYKTVTAVMAIVCTVLLACLAGVIGFYNGVVSVKDSQITSLQNEVDDLRSKLEAQKAVWLRLINFFEQTYEPLNEATHFVYISGTVVNFGAYPAYNVKMHVFIFDGSNVLIKNETLYLWNIDGKGYVNFGTNVYYSGHMGSLTYDLSYSITP
jgi:hypothetical protein